MKIIDEIRDIEAHNKYAADFYDYGYWEIDDIMLDMAWGKGKKRIDITPIGRRLNEILSYCVLRELNKYGFTDVSEKYYQEIQDTCAKFNTSRKLDELYEELEIEDPYKEKEPEDTWSKYDYDWGTERE
ncbi:MAG: hypothetical protein J6R32_06425 [Bacteroidales bacterium]|nr:hypothetical protein [Bacteroidales bacterium]